MLNDPRAATTSREDQDHDHDVQIRDIHALSPPHTPPPPTTTHLRRRETWETSSHISSSLSMASEGASSENFTSMSREFSALVLAGTIENLHNNKINNIAFQAQN